MNFLQKILKNANKTPIFCTWNSKLQQKITSLSDSSFDKDALITQILICMPDVYENKIDYSKHQINSGIKLLIVQVLSHLRDKYISLKKLFKNLKQYHSPFCQAI